MKKLISILTMVLLCSQAFALNPAYVDIRVTVNHPPTDAQVLSPEDGGVITEDDMLNIEVDATDLNIDDVLEFQYYINDVVINEIWTASKSITYQLTENDIGLNRVYAKVRDGRNEVQTTSVEIFVFRKSPTLPE